MVRVELKEVIMATYDLLIYWVYSEKIRFFFEVYREFLLDFPRTQIQI